VTQIEKKQLKMPHPVEAPRKRREAPGQAEAEELVYWLNKEPETLKQRKQQQRIGTLLRLLADSVDVQNAIGSKDAIRMYAAARPIYQRIAKLVSRYSYPPDLRLTWQSRLLSVQPWNRSTLVEYGDHDAVKAILRVAERGRIDAIRQCDGCAKWIFAKKAGQTTCGEAICRARKMRKKLTEQELVERRRNAKERYHYKKTHADHNRMKDAK
jgi:hypothetical protein